MAIEQTSLLKLSPLYDKGLNQEFYSTQHSLKKTKPRIFINHDIWDFRMVQGFVVMLSLAGIDAFFDWDDGYETDAQHEDSQDNLIKRVAVSTVCMLLATKKSVASPRCVNALKYATLIHRRIYIVQTEDKGKTYGEEFTKLNPQLDVSILGEYKKNFVVRVLKNKHSHFWSNVHNVSAL